ncbi:MAG: glycoside hydrolase family 3 C-terminal domain-containing protein [Nocardioides sp.]|uniref:beta-glucosidase n=1 Tax=Nocardioides sp. TaxID=35761 RepID=UPI0039E66D3A
MRYPFSLSPVATCAAATLGVATLLAGPADASAQLPTTTQVAQHHGHGGHHGHAGATTKRVARLVARMTLDEKLTLITGGDEATDPAGKTFAAGYIPGIERLGIPSLRLSDGPPGIATKDVSTGMTSTMGVAATWDPQTARRNGTVIGRDAKALGQDVALEPFINIDRDVTSGRGWNTFGEDPLLTGQMGAEEIRGIQSQGVMAQAKHYVAYDGASGNVVVDDQTLHEIYVKPFEDAVDAGVSSIMCSYNQVNGASACGNSDTLQTILRKQLGFTGFVTSDWGANHGTDYLDKGLDLEMPGSGLGGVITQYFAPAKIKAALADGSVKLSDVDTAVTRILSQYDRFGLLSGASKHTVTAEDVHGNAQVVRKTAAESAVLLKNDDSALPLDRSDLSGLALIGPGAGQTIATGGGGESSSGRADRWIGTTSTLKKEEPSANISYAVGDDLTGTAIPASALSHDGDPGLLRTTTGSEDTQVDSTLEFTSAKGNALPAGSSHTWTGTLTAPESGEYWINFGELGTTGTVAIDGTTVISSDGFLTDAPRYGTVKAGDSGVLPSTDGLNNKRAQVSLSAGDHTITVTQSADVSGDPVQAHLYWVTPSQQQADTDAAVAAATKAKTVVVFAYATQSGNLSTALPEGQDDLISKVAAANPNTIVVLQNNNPVAMPWLDDVKAVLEGWFPGDEGGWSFADLLTGRANPGGHLPYTWPASADQGVASDPDHPERSSTGVNPGTTDTCTLTSEFGGINECETDYSEGIDVGYRWYDSQGLTPLYEFGYGLSYTSFRYSDLRVSPGRGDTLTVRVKVSNTGNTAGDAVPQVYLGAPKSRPKGVQFADKALAAFDRVSLGAHRSTWVTMRVERRELSYWNSDRQRWTLATGSRTVYVGDSSRSLPLRESVRIR